MNCVPLTQRRKLESYEWNLEQSASPRRTPSSNRRRRWDGGSATSAPTIANGSPRRARYRTGRRSSEGWGPRPGGWRAPARPATRDGGAERATKAVFDQRNRQRSPRQREIDEGGDGREQVQLDEPAKGQRRYERAQHPRSGRRGQRRGPQERHRGDEGELGVRDDTRYRAPRRRPQPLSMRAQAPGWRSSRRGRGPHTPRAPADARSPAGLASDQDKPCALAGHRPGPASAQIVVLRAVAARMTRTTASQGHPRQPRQPPRSEAVRQQPGARSGRAAHRERNRGRGS